MRFEIVTHCSMTFGVMPVIPTNVLHCYDIDISYPLKTMHTTPNTIKSIDGSFLWAFTSLNKTLPNITEQMQPARLIAITYDTFAFAVASK